MIGATGPQGLQGIQGVIGATGSQGPAGPAGPIGPDGPAGATGSQGTVGTAGAVGATGPAGSTGPIGATGAAGSSPVPQYAYVYNDIGETVAADTDVTFNLNGKVTAGISHTPGGAAIGFTSAGDYKVTFSVSATEVNQTALFLNGGMVVGTVYGSGAGVQQNTGHAIVTIGAGDTLTVRNLSVSTAYSLAPSIGGPVPTTNASITIEKLN